MSKKRTDVPENKCTQNRTQELSYEEIKELIGVTAQHIKEAVAGH
ncbi:hypothetical protein [Bacillus sp. WP8]|nr:hypothetical protein [Bacillus sp. WP8]